MRFRWTGGRKLSGLGAELSPGRTHRLVRSHAIPRVNIRQLRERLIGDNAYESDRLDAELLGMLHVACSLILLRGL